MHHPLPHRCHLPHLYQVYRCLTLVTHSPSISVHLSTRLINNSHITPSPPHSHTPPAHHRHWGQSPYAHVSQQWGEACFWALKTYEKKKVYGAGLHQTVLCIIMSARLSIKHLYIYDRDSQYNSLKSLSFPPNTIHYARSFHISWCFIWELTNPKWWTVELVLSEDVAQDRREWKRVIESSSP